MPRKKRETSPPSQTELLDITAKLRTGPCVPALREAVKAWKAGGHKGLTDTTRILLNFWFETDHRTRANLPFKYHESQREAIETLVFVWECEQIRTRKGLLERYAQDLRDLRLPPFDEFARYCVKMATGSGNRAPGDTTPAARSTIIQT
jgi:type III restriction enzyme